jgi:hypothetical protein
MWIHYLLGVLTTLFVIALWIFFKWFINLAVCSSCNELTDNAVKHDDSRQFHASCLAKERSKPAIGECIICKTNMYPIDDIASYGENEKIHRRCAQCDDCGKAFNRDQRVVKMGNNTFYHADCKIYSCKVCMQVATYNNSTVIDGKVLHFHQSCACKHCKKRARTDGTYLCDECTKELTCSSSGCTGTVSLLYPIKSFKLNKSFCSIDCRNRAVKA